MIISTTVGEFELPTEGGSVAYPEVDGLVFVWLADTKQWCVCNGHTGKVLIMPFIS